MVDMKGNSLGEFMPGYQILMVMAAIFLLLKVLL
jgi:hypothetical protein